MGSEEMKMSERGRIKRLRTGNNLQISCPKRTKPRRWASGHATGRGAGSVVKVSVITSGLPLAIRGQFGRAKTTTSITRARHVENAKWGGIILHAFDVILRTWMGRKRSDLGGLIAAHRSPIRADFDSNVPIEIEFLSRDGKGGSGC